MNIGQPVEEVFSYTNTGEGMGGLSQKESAVCVIPGGLIKPNGQAEDACPTVH